MKNILFHYRRLFDRMNGVQSCRNRTITGIAAIIFFFIFSSSIYAAPNQAPRVGAINPASGYSRPNQAVVFSTTFSDPNGWRNIQEAVLLAGNIDIARNVLQPGYFCVYYNENLNKLYLWNNPTNKWIGGFAPGSARTIENQYGILNCRNTVILGAGTTLRIDWNITFKSAASGHRNTYLYVKDDIGLINNWAQAGSWIIDGTPPNGTIKINNKAPATNLIQVSLTLSANDALTGVSEMKFSNDNANWTAPEPYAAAENWNLTAGDGQKKVYVKYKDRAGNWSGAYSASIILDTIPPQNPAITIDQGNYTNNSNITLTLSAEGAREMLISDNPQFQNSQWEAYTQTKAILLSHGDGSKTIYIKYRDLARNETQPVNDSIILDTTIPQIQITSPENNLLTNQTQINVSGIFNEANINTITVNGIQAVIQANNFNIENVPLPNEGDNTITVQITDLVGNQNSSQINITRDTTPPQNSSVSIEEGDRANAKLIHILLSAVDAAETIISENQNFAGSNWEPYVERTEYTLNEGEGLKRIYIKFRDRAGNETQILETKIIIGSILTITSPRDGLTINASWITVTGTVNSEILPVYINGILTKALDNTFHLDQIPLAVGTNTITAQTYLDGELLEQISINILTQELIDPVQITAVPLSGEPNLEVTFTATTNLENPVTNYGWDFDNDGGTDWQSENTGNTTHTYNEVRQYHPTLRITDSNGTQYSTSVTINVHLPRRQEWAIDIEDPIDIAVDTQRNLYILQHAQSQIQKFDKDGNPITTIGEQGQIAGAFSNPSGIAIDTAGNIYVADTGNNRIQKLTPDGIPDINFGIDGVVGINADNDADGILDAGAENNQFNQPYGIAVDGKGNIYVSDTGNNRIQKFSPIGEFLLKWDIQSPNGISADTFGDTYTASANTNQIQIFTGTGSQEGTYNTVNSPTDIAISNSYIYIADTGNNEIQKIDKENLQFVSTINSFINGGNRENITNPVAVALDTNLQNEMIYVADRTHNKVIKIELPIISPSQTIDTIKQELSAGNISNALNSFTEDTKQKYQEIFNLIRNNLPEAVNNMNDIHPVTIQDNYAEYIMVRQEDGEEYGYFITFIKDENGEWKIKDM